MSSVPLNARFLIELADFDHQGQKTAIDREAIRWIEVDTEQLVSFDVIATAGMAGQVWLVPTQNLSANANYAIEVGPVGNPAFGQTFRTGMSIDTSPPQVEAPRIVSNSPSDACGAFHGAILSWDSVRDNGEQVLYDPVVEVRVQSGSGSTVLFQDAINVGSGRGVQLAIPGDHDGSACWLSAGLPVDTPRESLTVTMSVYDWAGNKTDLAPIEVDLRSNPGASCPNAQGDCSVGRRGAGQTWAALLLVPVIAFLTWRRNRVTALRSRDR